MTNKNKHHRKAEARRTAVKKLIATTPLEDIKDLLNNSLTFDHDKSFILVQRKNYFKDPGQTKLL